MHKHVISTDGRQGAFSRGSAGAGVTVWLMDVASSDTSRFSFASSAG